MSQAGNNLLAHNMTVVSAGAQGWLIKEENTFFTYKQKKLSLELIVLFTFKG